METGLCRRKMQDGSLCQRIALGTRGEYLARNRTSWWVLLCAECTAELDDLLELYLLGQESAPWQPAPLQKAADGNWWSVKEIRNFLASFRGRVGRRNVGLLSKYELNGFESLLAGVADDIDSHVQPEVVKALRERIFQNRMK